MTHTHERLGVLFLGCGRAATMHSRTLRGIGGLDLSYASRSHARADALCRRFEGRQSYPSYEAALADSDATVVLVATPTVFHREQALLALEAGKHVIVEKPAFGCASDAGVVDEMAIRTGRRVFVAENYFYKPLAAYLRRIVRSGELGDIRFVTLNATKQQAADGWRADPSMSGGGALFEGGVHWVSFASNLGLDVEDVHGYRVGPSDGPDRSALVVFRYRGGAVGTLAHSWEIPAPFGGLRLSRMQGTAGAVTFESNGLLHVTTGRRPSAGIFLRDPLGSRAMFGDFLSAIRTGAATQFTLDMARRDLVLLEQAQRSRASEDLLVLPGSFR